MDVNRVWALCFNRCPIKIFRLDSSVSHFEEHRRVGLSLTNNGVQLLIGAIYIHRCILSCKDLSIFAAVVAPDSFWEKYEAASFRFGLELFRTSELFIVIAQKNSNLQ